MLYFTYIYLISFIFWGPKLSKKQKVFFAALPLIVISFIRFGYGADYFSYGRIYHDIDMSSIKNAMFRSVEMEPLYLGVNYLGRLIGLDYHIFAGILTSLISVFTIYWLVDYSPNFEWSVLLYYVMHYSVWNLSAIRQGFTMTLIFYFLFNKRSFTTQTKIIVVLVAMGFHTASIIVAMIYLVSKFPWKRKWFLLLLLLVPVARLILTPEVLIMFENIPLVTRMIRYIQEDPIKLISFPSLVRLFFLIAVYIHYEKLNEKHADYRVLFNFVILSFILYFFIPFSKVVATRVTVYGYFLTIIVFPMIMRLYEKKPYKQLVVAGLSLFTLLSFYNEFDKMRDRSGFTQSLTMMNTVTIFNKDYSLFDKQFALHEQINERNNNQGLDQDILEKVLANNVEIEAQYDPNLTHISVYFPNLNMYGIINEEGKIITEPKEYSEVNVFGNVKGVRYPKETNLNSYYYEEIDTGLTARYEDFKESWEIDNSNHFEREINKIETENINLEDYYYLPQVYEYNMVPVEEAFIHTDGLAGMKYLEIKTSYKSYFSLLDARGNSINDKWYNWINPFNKNGIIRGGSINGTEFINRKGEIIWAIPN